jgi:hypothetical protein
LKEEVHTRFAYKLIFVVRTEWDYELILVSCDVKNGPTIGNVLVVVLALHDYQKGELVQFGTV